MIFFFFYFFLACVPNLYSFHAKSFSKKRSKTTQNFSFLSESQPTRPSFSFYFILWLKQMLSFIFPCCYWTILKESKTYPEKCLIMRREYLYSMLQWNLFSYIFVYYRCVMFESICLQTLSLLDAFYWILLL